MQDQRNDGGLSGSRSYVKGRWHKSKRYGDGGAPQVSDLRLVEDGGERSCALVSKAVATETASEGQNGNGECRCVDGR